MPPLDTQHGILASHFSRAASFRFLRWEQDHEEHILQRKDTRPWKNSKPLYTETKACGDHLSPLLGVVECMQTLPRTFREDTAG